MSGGDAHNRFALLAENPRWPERIHHLVPVGELNGFHQTGQCRCGPKCVTVLGEGNLPMARVYEHRVLRP